MCLATLYSSASTPMPHLPSFEASFRAPSPQRPATWKTTCAYWLISFCAIVAHFVSSSKSPEYWTRIFVPFTALFAQYS